MGDHELNQSVGRLVAATAGTMGQSFFEATAKTIAEVTGVRSAIVAVLEPSQKPTRVQCAYGWSSIGALPPFEYELRGTPCEAVVEIGARMHESGAADLFPSAKVLQDLEVQSYYGVAIMDANGNPIGILAALHDEPRSDLYQSRALLELFAIHTAAEIERQRSDSHMLDNQDLANLGALAGGMANDLHRQLHDILSHIVHAKPAVHDVNAQDHLDAAARMASMAADVTRRMLAQSVGQSGQPQTIDMAAHVQRAIHMIRRKNQSLTSLDIDADRELPPFTGDPAQLHQVIVNLLGQATEGLTKHDGNVSVRLAMIPADASEYAHCQFRAGGFSSRVGHFGIRITRTEQSVNKSHFRNFLQGPSSSDNLELSAIRCMVENLGGAITAEPTTPETTAIHVYLPPQRPSQASPPQQEAVKQSSTQRILVVDDNDIVRTTLSRTLQRLGFEVSEAATGTEALGLLEDLPHPFDCMIIDRVMPGLSGPQLIVRIRQSLPDVPIVLTTGFSGKTDLELAEGMIDGMLPKPWTTKDVTRVIQRAIDKRSRS